MRKFIPFIPVIGIFLVIRLVIKGEITSEKEIWPNGLYYFGSAFVQAIGIIILMLPLLMK